MVNMNLKKSCSVMNIRPFAFFSYSMGARANAMIIFLTVQFLMLLWTKSYASALIIISATLASMLSEAVYFLSHRNISTIHCWRISIIQGLLIGFLIPSTYPLVTVFVVVAASLFLGKYVFGEFADSWVNICALTVVILYILNIPQFPDNTISFFDLQLKNPALILVNRGTVPLASCDSGIINFLNKTVFRLFSVSVPDGYVTLFIDNFSEIPAFRFNFITLVSSLFLFSFGMVDMIIPMIFLLVYAVLIRIAGPLFVGAAPFQGDMILAILTSGTLFCSLYLLQWYGTAPVTVSGKIVYSVLGGILAFFIVGYGTSSCGFVFLILVLNLFSPIIQVFEDRCIFKKVVQVQFARIKKMKEVE